MRVAREFANDRVRVELLTAQFSEDRSIIPPYFRMLPDLAQSVFDKHAFTVSKKYPLVSDVLKLLLENTDADYLIYTNSDIALMPHFYAAVSELLKEGHDALIINRRRVSRRFKSVSELPLIWSEIGGPHPGFDCFVLHRALIPKMSLGNVCIGVPFVEATLAYNVFAHSRSYRLLTDKHLTVHIGMEVMPQRIGEYHRFNQSEFNKIYRQLRPLLTGDKLPYSESGFFRKIMKWGLNPAVFILPNLEIEAEGAWNRFKTALNELRWKALEK